MKILGVGVDIVKNARIKNLTGKKNFIFRTFTKNEIKFLFRIKILSLLFLTISTPTPKIFMLLNYSFKFFNYIV